MLEALFLRQNSAPSFVTHSSFAGYLLSQMDCHEVLRLIFPKRQGEMLFCCKGQIVQLTMRHVVQTVPSTHGFSISISVLSGIFKLRLRLPLSTSVWMNIRHGCQQIVQQLKRAWDICELDRGGVHPHPILSNVCAWHKKECIKYVYRFMISCVKEQGPREQTGKTTAQNCS